MEQLKSQNVAHRDFKPCNMMIDENKYIKVIDFGEAKIVEKSELDDAQSIISKTSKYSKRSGINRQNSNSSEAESYFGRMLTKKPNHKPTTKQKHRGTFVGTPFYCAPEMLESNMSGYFSDLWALGVIIYEMSCGKKMFRAKNNQEIFDKIIKK